MTFTPNVYSIILIICGLLNLYMCERIFRRYEVVVRWFGFMMLCVAIWAISYGFELSSTRLEQMLFWADLEYLGIAFVPAFWLLFLLKFTGKDIWLKTRNFFILFLIPFITLLMVWTNNYHHLHYKSVGVDHAGPFPLLDIETGPWHIVHIIYSYVLLFLGLILLLDKYRKSDQVFKRQNLTLLIALFIPWISNILYLFGFRPLGHIDSTPFAFIITMLFISIGLVRFKLMDIIPIARDKVIESMNEGLVVTDSQDRIIDSNQEFRKILSITDKKIVGKNLDYYLSGQVELNKLIQKRNGGQIQIRFVKSGMFLEASLKPLFENEQVYIGLIILFRDITERVAIENKMRLQSEQLLSMNKLKDRLFSIIAHDLRAPLINLNDIIKMLKDEMITEEEFKSFVPQLSKNIGYTTSLLENLLFWSKSQLQGEVVKPVYFNLKELTVNTINLYENILSEKDIEIQNTINLSDKAYADKDMIQLVIRNLVFNAIKFSKRAGRIKLSSSKEGKFSEICIEDNGVGISTNDQKKLFELETFTTRGTDNEQGTGLGLLLCKDFIEKNNGKVWVESELGKGSKFCILIPNSPDYKEF